MSCSRNSDGCLVYLQFKKAGKKMSNSTQSRKFDWSDIVSELGQTTVREFANGVISGRELYDNAIYSPVGGEVRRLLRERGVSEARQLARKALSRR